MASNKKTGRGSLYLPPRWRQECACARAFFEPRRGDGQKSSPFLFDVNRDSPSKAIFAALFPNMVQDGPKMAPRWPQDGPRCPKMIQDGPESARAHAHCWQGLLGPSWTMLGRSAAEMALDGESLLTSNKKRGGGQSPSPRRDPKHARAHADSWRHLCPIQTLQLPAGRPLQAQGEGVRGRGKPFPGGEEGEEGVVCKPKL